MIPKELLPKISNFTLARLELANEQLTLVAKIPDQTSCCPICKNSSNKIHSSYTRQIFDLPWAGVVVNVRLKINKFFCQNDNCIRKIFCQRLEGLAAYARRTERQRNYLLAIGLTAGGNPGARLSSKLGMPVSTSTILRLLNAQIVADFDTPRVLGVDDWAIRKGQNYGTILVDLEKRKPIDLLIGRESDALQEWLEHHPGVEIISRDRASAYSEGASKGAPDAIQVADRWHLLKNMTDALKRMMNKYNQASRKTAVEIAKRGLQEELPKGSVVINPPANNSAVQNEEKLIPTPSIKKGTPSKYELMFETVKKLQKEGASQRAISKHLGISRKTVCKYFEYNEYPKRICPPSQEPKANKFDDYLRKKWKEGVHNYYQLWREIKQKGFDGSYASLYKYMVKEFSIPGSAKQTTTPKIKVYSARRLSFLLSKEKEQLKEKEQEYLNLLFTYCPEAKTANDLALRYRDILVNQKAHLLDNWIESAMDSGKEVLKNFAQNLLKDYDAIKNACSLEWSNGQVEGQVNRLKNIKRKMYGRASFELLKKMVLADYS